MNIRRCRDCNQYKYIESNGLCRSCYTGMKDRSSEYNLTYNPTDFLNFKKGSNQLVLGMIGSGKTVGNKIEIAEILRQNKDVEAYIVDPLGGYRDFTEEFDGNIIDIDDTDSFNIFNYFGADKKGDLESKTDQVYDFLTNCLYEADVSLSPIHDNLLKSVISKTYKRNGVTPETSKVRNPPVFSDMINVIKYLKSNPSTIMKKNASHSQKKRVKSSLSELQTELVGVDKKFNISTNSSNSPSSNRINYYDMEKVSSSIADIKFHSIFNEIWEQSRNSDRKSILYIDNAGYLIDLDKPIPSLKHCFATARSRDISICLSTSKTQEFLRSNATNGIIGSIYNIRIHKLKGDCDQVQVKFGLSDSQISYLKNADIGSSSSPSQILRRYGNKGFNEDEITVDSSLLDDI